MAKVCEICGKGPRTGNRIIRHGLEKKKGGIGLHTTGITRRRFLPNVQRMRIRLGERTVRRNVCMACLKSGNVSKA